jgi:hypothetical protein
MIDFLDEHRKFIIPLFGKGRYTIEVNLQVHLVANALREAFPQDVREFSRNRIAELIFLDYNNLNQLPPKSCALLKRIGKAQIREMIPKLADKLIVWDDIILATSAWGEIKEFKELLKAPL